MRPGGRRRAFTTTGQTRPLGLAFAARVRCVRCVHSTLRSTVQVLLGSVSSLSHRVGLTYMKYVLMLIGLPAQRNHDLPRRHCTPHKRLPLQRHRHLNALPSLEGAPVVAKVDTAACSRSRVREGVRRSWKGEMEGRSHLPWPILSSRVRVSESQASRTTGWWWGG